MTEQQSVFEPDSPVESLVVLLVGISGGLAIWLWAAFTQLFDANGNVLRAFQLDDLNANDVGISEAGIRRALGYPVDVPECRQPCE